MALTLDIAAMYRRPRTVVRRLMALGPREDRALLYLMLGCALIFVAQWPRLAREANLKPEIGQEICAAATPPIDPCDAVAEATQALLGGALLAWIFLVPLAAYVIAALTRLIAKLVGGQGTWYRSRLALFWSLLASAPLWLLNGLVAGLIGGGPQLKIVSGLALAVFVLFWAISLREAEYGEGSA